jgi:abortive infection bacteriophage resistance protein
MPKLPYSKPALSPAALLAHVASRGLTVSDPVTALHALEYIGYYRLLGYMRPLQRTDGVTGLRHFIPGTTFGDVLTLYDFDREHYGTPELPPIWAIMEALTFGAFSRLFSGLALRHRKAVALRFGHDESVLSSWFRAISLVRNLSAHHSRLWNAPMHVDQPIAAKKLRSEMMPTDRLYARLVVLAALLEMIEPGSDWKRRLAGLMERYPTVPLVQMGIPAGWEARPFWASAPACSR